MEGEVFSGKNEYYVKLKIDQLRGEPIIKAFSEALNIFLGERSNRLRNLLNLFICDLIQIGNLDELSGMKLIVRKKFEVVKREDFKELAYFYYLINYHISQKEDEESLKIMKKSENHRNQLSKKELKTFKNKGQH